MAVTDEDEERTVRLLLADVNATLGSGHESIVRANARRMREFAHEVAEYVRRVVDDTQQDIHDGFIDTAWPKCPLHDRHPVWFHDGGWWCEQRGILVARLGELQAP